MGDRVCDYCQAKPKTLPLLQCSRCKKVIYCNRECRRAAWKTHKKICFPASEKKCLEAIKLKAQETKIEEKEEEKKGGEDYGQCLKKETKLKKEYASLIEGSGLDDPKTLKVAFQLVHMWLGLYKLSPCNELIEEVWPACKKNLMIKVINNGMLKLSK